MKDFENESGSVMSVYEETPDTIFEKMKANLLSDEDINLELLKIVSYDFSQEIMKLKVELVTHTIAEPELLNIKWMNSREVLKLLGVTKRTLEAIRDDGRLPYSQLGGILYYKKKDVIRLYEAKYAKYSR
jgi:hypothetical protein